jgi:hypothetical protein
LKSPFDRPHHLSGFQPSCVESVQKAVHLRPFSAQKADPACPIPPYENNPSRT